MAAIANDDAGDGSQTRGKHSRLATLSVVTGLGSAQQAVGVAMRRTT